MEMAFPRKVGFDIAGVRGSWPPLLVLSAGIAPLKLRVDHQKRLSMKCSLRAKSCRFWSKIGSAEAATDSAPAAV